MSVDSVDMLHRDSCDKSATAIVEILSNQVISLSTVWTRHVKLPSVSMSSQFNHSPSSYDG